MKRHAPGFSALWLVILLGFLTTVGAGVGGYMLRDNQATEQLADKDKDLSRLQKKLDAQTASPEPSTLNQSGATPPPAATSTRYSSANLGFTLQVPKEWASQWRYQENAAIGISTSSVTFYLINKDTKYAEVVTIGKIPQAKYDDAKATNQPIANPDNLLLSAGGNAYVMTFPDGATDFKNFTYSAATTAAKESFKSSFKLI
jgi:hypothetical protein